MLSDRTPTAVVFCFCIGILIGTNADGTSFMLIIAASGVLCLALAAAHRFFNIDIKRIAAIAAALIIGVFYVNIFGMLTFTGYDGYIGRQDHVTASVVDTDAYAGKSSAVLTVIESSAGLPQNTRVRMWHDGETPLRRGDAVSADLTYASLSDSSARADYIQLSATGEIYDVQNGTGFTDRLRSAVRDAVVSLYSAYGSNVSDVACTVVGVGDGLSTGIYAVYRNAGIAHLLVISGFHVSLIVIIFTYLLSLVNVRMQIRNAIGIAVAVALALFVGFTPGIIRSVFMICCMLLCRMLFRRHDQLASLAVALAILAVINPYMICSASLQLSFTACIAIIAVQPIVARLRKKIESRLLRHVFNLVAVPVLVSLAVSIGTLPIMLRFGTASWISPVTNIFITTLFGYAVAIEIISVVLFAVFGGSASFAAYPAGMFYKYIHKLLFGIYSLKLGGISTALPYFALTAAFALLAAAAVLSVKNIRIRSACAAVFAVLTVASAVTSATCFNIYNNNNSIILTSYKGGGGYCLIADKGDNTYVDLGGRGNDTQAYEYGYSLIDSYIITKLDDYSLSRFGRAASLLYIDEVYVDPDCDIGLLSRLYAVAESINCTVSVYDIAAVNKNGSVVVTDSRIDMGERVCILFGSDAYGCASDTVIALDGFSPQDGAAYFAGTLVSGIDQTQYFAYSKHFRTDFYGGIKVNITNECEVSLLEH